MTLDLFIIGPHVGEHREHHTLSCAYKDQTAFIRLHYYAVWGALFQFIYSRLRSPEHRRGHSGERVAVYVA